MTALEWDKVGERFYQKGIDRGVLYLKDGRSAAWNGLVSVDDGSDSDRKSFYMDGVKIYEKVIPGDFVGKLSAFTYPDEFDEVVGIVESAGLSFYDQRSKQFNLSYRTFVGSDLDPDHHYKIHIFYNLLAIQDSYSFETVSESLSPSPFSWSLSGVPVITFGRRPTVHVSIDSEDTDPTLLANLEDTLYGTDTTDPSLPDLEDLRHLVGELGGLTIVDHGDGTWSAIDPSDDYVAMVDDETFSISHADIEIIDWDTYTVSDTETPLP